MSRRNRLLVAALEERATPAVLAGTSELYAAGSTDGSAGVYRADGAPVFEVRPFGDSYTGAVRVALADVTGDGAADLIASAGPGGPSTVKVYDGASKAEVASFAAYEASFKGGVHLAAADLNGDGRAEIVTGADEGGGPRARVFDGATVSATGGPTVLADFLAIDDAQFRGGIRLALGDLDGDRTPDLLVGAGFGGGPRTAVFDGESLAAGGPERLMADFFAFEAGLRNGVYASVGDVNGDGVAEMVFGAGPGGAPRVRALNGMTAPGKLTEVANFFAGDAASRKGVQVSVGYAVDGEAGPASIVAVDRATELVRLFDANGFRLADFDPEGGVGWVSCEPFAPPPGDSGGTEPGPGPGDDSVIGDASGVYAGDADGTLSIRSDAGAEPEVRDASASVLVDIDYLLADPYAYEDGETPPPDAGFFKLIGTLSVDIEGWQSLSGAFRAPIELTPTETDPTAGTFVLRTDWQPVNPIGIPGGDFEADPRGAGVILYGRIADGVITVDELIAYNTSPAGVGWVYRAPVDGGTPPTLVRSAGDPAVCGVL